MSNEKHTERDYSLLRPFDLEAAKRGDEFVFICEGSGQLKKRKFVAEKNGHLVVDYGDRFQITKIDFAAESYRMSPLCWVEGRPVYRGDVLWWTTQGRWITARAYENMQNPGVKDDNDCESDVAWLTNLTWTPPKVKREGWVNIYPSADFIPADAAIVSNAFSSKEKADLHAMSRRIACVRIEWEEVAQ